MDNMAYWNRVCTTDPKYTKKIAGKKFQGTDIKPAYRVQLMTEAFGPAGKGWGYEVQSHWKEPISTRYKDNKGEWKDLPTECVFVMLRVWWSEDGGLTKYYTGSQIGGTETKDAVDECYKMAITDALGKCLVDLGVCADVYLGEFGNDSKYSRQHEPANGSKSKAADQSKSAGKPAAKPAEQSKPPSNSETPSMFSRAMGAIKHADQPDKLVAIRGGIEQQQFEDGEVSKLLTELYCKASELADEGDLDAWQLRYMDDAEKLSEPQAKRITRAFESRKVVA